MLVDIDNENSGNKDNLTSALPPPYSLFNCLSLTASCPSSTSSTSSAHAPRAHAFVVHPPYAQSDDCRLCGPGDRKGCQMSRPVWPQNGTTVSAGQGSRVVTALAVINCTPRDRVIVKTLTHHTRWELAVKGVASRGDYRQCQPRKWRDTGVWLRTGERSAATGADGFCLGC